MKPHEKVISAPLLEILVEKKPQEDDPIFFADESKVKIKGRRMEMVLGLGSVPYSYFLNSPPDGLLEKSMSVEPVVYEKSRDLNAALKKTMAGMLATSYERNLDRGESDIIAYVICNCLDVSGVTSDAYNILYERGHTKFSLPKVINVGGSSREGMDGKLVRSPKDYDYKQKVGEYASSIYKKKMTLR